MHVGKDFYHDESPSPRLANVRHDALVGIHRDTLLVAYNLNSGSEEKIIRNTSILGPRLEYVFRNTCGIRPEYCEYEQNTSPWEVVCGLEYVEYVFNM